VSFDIQRLDHFEPPDFGQCAHAREQCVILVGGANEIMHHDDFPCRHGQRVERADLSVGNGLEQLVSGAELGACHRLVVGHTLGHARSVAASCDSGGGSTPDD
jgi:hypothetical protein